MARIRIPRDPLRRDETRQARQGLYGLYVYMFICLYVYKKVDISIMLCKYASVIVGCDRRR